MLLCCLVFTSSSIAQVLYGSVVGNIKDSSGATIPGATVTITNKATSLTRDVQTSADGSYSIVNVLPDT